MSRAPSLLLVSDSPSSSTGLGGQAKLLFEAATAAGFHVTVANLCLGTQSFPPRFYHAQGMIPEYLTPLPIPPDTAGYIMNEVQPDAIVALCDPWMLGALTAIPRALARLHLWTTADHEIFPDGFRTVFERCPTLVFMAEFGARSWGPAVEKARAGKRTLMIPHAVDGDLFRPIDDGGPEEHRKHFGLEDHFIALHVGRNQWRKQQPLLIEGWARFVRGLPESERSKVTLYLHTEEQSPPSFAGNSDPILNLYAALYSGWNLPQFLRKNYDEEVQRTIRFSRREISKAALAGMYNVADVHVLTSMGEGFGVPLIEAQACGRANIAADNTTTPEIVGGEPVGGEHAIGLDGPFAIWEQEARGEGAPFGWRVPCNSFLVQPDFSGKRPLVDCDALADAFADACDLARLKELNAPEATARRRAWTLGRYGWNLIRSKWEALLAEIREQVVAP